MFANLLISSDKSKEYQGQGIGKYFLACILDHKEIKKDKTTFINY